MLDVNKVEALYLGIRGENRCRTIQIDMSPWMTAHPNGTCSIWHKRTTAPNKEATGATFDPETNVLTWILTGINTYEAGYGIVEIRLTEDGVIKKSRDIPALVSPSLIGENGDTLESDWQAYLNDMEARKQGALNAKTGAEAWAIGKRNGADVEEGDETYQNNAKYYAIMAAGALQAEITAERWAVGKHLGEDVPPTDETYHNNSKYYADQTAADRAYVQRAAAAVERAEQAAAAAEAAAATAAAAMAIVGSEFDPTEDYLEGAYCLKSGQMYRFTQDHPAGAWTGTDVTAEPIDAALSGISSGTQARAFHHLGLYLDSDGDLCQED